MANVTASTVSKFTGLTATLKLGAHEIGSLQNVSWDETTNIVRVPSIGSPIDAYHLSGKTEYNVTASRVLIDGDAMITALSATIAYDADTQSEITTVSNLFTYLAGNAATTLDRNTKVMDVVFDIQLTDLESGLVVHFNECRMQSKRSRLDANGVIVSEDVTFFARQKSLTDLNSTVISSASKE